MSFIKYLKEDLNNNEIEESLKDKIGIMNRLALNIANNLIKNQELTKKLSDEDLDFMYGIADGLIEKYIMDIINGQTSIKVQLDHPPEKLEKMVDDYIIKLKNIIKKLNYEF